MGRTWMGLLLLAGVGMAYRISQPGPLWPPAPVSQPPGLVLAPDAPRQTAMGKTAPIDYQDLQLQPLARFEFDARLLSLAWYTRGAEADYSPVDLGIAWGRMSDSAHIDQLQWTHGTRFLNYRYMDQPPIPQRELDRSIANLHVLPADEYVLRRIEALRPGERVRGSGLLVAAKRADGWHWTSSLTREDTGNGACELIYLTAIEVH